MTYIEWEKLNFQMEKIHKEEVKDMRERLWKIQISCKSNDFTYHPDPSGNNDSEFECNECRAWFRRIHPGRK